MMKEDVGERQVTFHLTLRASSAVLSDIRALCHTLDEQVAAYRYKTYDFDVVELLKQALVEAEDARKCLVVMQQVLEEDIR